MSLWPFILCISSLLRDGNCLDIGFLFFNLAHVPFHSASVGWLVFLPCHCTAPAMISLIFLLCCYLWAYTMSISYIIPSFGLYCPAFLLGQSISYLGLPRPISFFFWASLARFILSYLFHSHELLLNSLGFPSPITTSLPLGLLAFEPTPFTNPFLWASLAHFYFLSISYNSHGPTNSFLGAFLAHLLSFRSLIILVGLLTIILAILA